MVDYCTSEDVEGVLRETLAESFDDLIARCITTGSCLVDSLLKIKGLLVSSVVPVLVVEAAAWFAAPCAFMCAYDQNQGYSWSGYKNFAVGNYTKARFVLDIKAPDPYNQQSVEINIDGVAKKQRDVHLPADTWCRLTYKMPVNKTTLVRVHSQTYSGAVVIDEIWVIAKY